MSTNDCSEGFCGIGYWQGVAEVYDGQGRFLGNGADQRHVRTQEEDGRIRIDLSFVGPLKFAGHYYIRSEGSHRLYQGPANCGYAEALGAAGVTANAYWPSTGLSQKFFLMVAPDGQRQLSLALMSRGEQLLYAVVGENAKVVNERPLVAIPIVNGGTYDLQHDPKAGRSSLLVHKPGHWEGELHSLRGSETEPSCQAVSQIVASEGDRVRFIWGGSSFVKADLSCLVTTNQWQGWTELGDFVGSYSVYGGRALAGQFHHLPAELRVFRREVLSADGQHKALVNIWYSGEQRIGLEWGWLKLRDAGA